MIYPPRPLLLGVFQQPLTVSREWIYTRIPYGAPVFVRNITAVWQFQEEGGVQIEPELRFQLFLGNDAYMDSDVLIGAYLTPARAGTGQRGRLVGVIPTPIRAAPGMVLKLSIEGQNSGLPPWISVTYHTRAAWEVI